MTRKNFFLIGMVFLAVQGWSDELKILAIGNSFAQNALTYFREITAAARHRVLAKEACIGGCDLERHMRHVNAFEADPADPEGHPYANGKSLQELLTQEKWDVVTIQQVSHNSFLPETYHPYVDQLIGYIRRHAPQAEIVIHQTWAYRDDHHFWGRADLSTDIMYAGLRAAYDQLARETGFRMIPSGDAMEAARQDPEWGKFIPDPAFDPKTSVYPALPQNEQRSLHNAWYGWRKDEKNKGYFLSQDAIHANLPGKYLLGCVWFEFFFGDSVVGNSFRPDGLSETDAAILQRIAHWTVTEKQRPNLFKAIPD